ncbi:MAG TPA: MCE family protein [Nocardioides sp.]|nr:MCE family protein [Nocardioides sp.]
MKRVVVAPLLGLLLVTGCGPGLKDVPLPGTGVSGETITVRADFAEALNLAEGATVRVNGVDSGKVQDVEVEDFHARAEMLVKTDAELREGATARLRYTTPLGELFVDITNPAKGASLEDGDTLALADTSTAPTVEDALAQASLLVNGGGLEQLQTVTEELNTAVGGREDTVRTLLGQAETFLTEANATTADIDRALQALSSVSKTLRGRQQVINRAVREIRPAAKVLRENTPGLTELLAEIEDFSSAANTTVQQTREQLLTIIHQAEPVLDEFVRNQGRYVLSLKRLVAAGEVVEEIVPGDYVALLLAAHLDGVAFGQLEDLLGVLGLPLLDDLLGRDRPMAGKPKASDDRPVLGPDGTLLDPLKPLSLTGLLGGLL